MQRLDRLGTPATELAASDLYSLCVQTRGSARSWAAVGSGAGRSRSLRRNPGSHGWPVLGTPGPRYCFADFAWLTASYSRPALILGSAARVSAGSASGAGAATGAGGLFAAFSGLGCGVAGPRLTGVVSGGAAIGPRPRGA
jgi:hypothetical protein